jgi:LemA protein
MSWVAIIIIVLIVLLLIVGVLQFNRLRRLNVQVDGAFAGIDTLLTKRADLIPNLVETVKGAAGFEQSTLQAVTDARASIGQARTVEETAAADNMLTQALGRLFAVAEAYPQLTATQGYIELQRQLQQVECELKFARNFYN